MKSTGRFKQLQFSIEDCIDQTVLYDLPEHLSADTQDLLLEQVTELALQFQKKLRYALKGKYDVRYCTLNAILEKAHEPDTENATTGRR